VTGQLRPARSWGGDACGDWPQLQCYWLDDFEAGHVKVAMFISGVINNRAMSFVALSFNL